MFFSQVPSGSGGKPRSPLYVQRLFSYIRTADEDRNIQGYGYVSDHCFQKIKNGLCSSLKRIPAVPSVTWTESHFKLHD